MLVRGIKEVHIGLDAMLRFMQQSGDGMALSRPPVYFNEDWCVLVADQPSAVEFVIRVQPADAALREARISVNDGDVLLAQKAQIFLSILRHVQHIDRALQL